MGHRPSGICSGDEVEVSEFMPMTAPETGVRAVSSLLRIVLAGGES